MAKDVPEIVRVAHLVGQVLHKMAAGGVIEAAAVYVKNLAWVVDMQGREAWYLTLCCVEPTTEEKLIRALMHEMELIGLGWDDWDVYTESEDESNESCQAVG